MNIKDIEITKREILVCIIITLILVGLGFIISGAIKNSISESNEIYYKALKIDNNEEQFKYAIKTNIGNVLVKGKVEAVEGVSIEDIEGKYFYIEKVKEKYTMHTREIEHTRIVGNKTEIYYTTEEYWTWDYVGEEEFHTERFKFLEVNFDYGTINFTNKQYKETKNAEYHIRYVYYIIPFEFEGTLFTNINNNTINNNKFYYNKTIEDIITEKQNEESTTMLIFWIIWILFIGFIDFRYVSMENKYLED